MRPVLAGLAHSATIVMPDAGFLGGWNFPNETVFRTLRNETDSNRQWSAVPIVRAELSCQNLAVQPVV